MKIENVPLSEVIPYTNNPRKNDKAVDVVAKSIKEFGFKVPIILDKNNVIVAGHTRLKAATKLGLLEVPVVWADDLTPSQIKAFRIMDNKSSEYATWDMDMLKEEIIDLKEEKFDLDLTGLKEVELRRLLDPEEEPNIGNKPAKYKINNGDIYQLGDHKIICGDSTLPETYSKLLGDEKVGAIYTDPPYGVSYKGINNPNGRNWKVIEGDDLRKDGLYQMLQKAFSCMSKHLTPKRAVYVFHASANQIIFETALNSTGFQVKQQLIWQKHLVLGHSHYHWSHEPLFYCSRINEDNEFFGDRMDKTILNRIDPDKMTTSAMKDFIRDYKAQSSVWDFKKDNTQDYIHPTQKPVHMAERAIINSSRPGDVILDPFAGSGSTLMACEESKRKGRTIELDPNFVSHIIERWENKTGKKSQKI